MSSAQSSTSVPKQENIIVEETVIISDGIQLPRGRKKLGESDEFKWKDSETDTFISLWQGYESLFNPKVKKFNDSDPRFSELQRFQEELQEVGINVTIEQISSKINSLKTYYLKERGKVLTSKSNSWSGENMYISRWRFFESLTFLDEHVPPRKTMLSSAQEVNGCCENSFVSKGPKVPKLGQDNGTEPMFEVTERNKSYIIPRTQTQTIVSTVQTEMDINDPDALFGKVIECLMRKVPNGLTKELLKIDLQKRIIDKAMLEGSEEL